eukprot:364850-Chlamydomonas_euryale.AAC.9
MSACWGRPHFSVCQPTTPKKRAGVHRSSGSFNVHHSVSTIHRPQFNVHQRPFTMHHAPHTVYLHVYSNHEESKHPLAAAAFDLAPGDLGLPAAFDLLDPAPEAGGLPTAPS